MVRRKKIRTRGKIQLSKYFQNLEKGDRVSVVRERSLNSSFPQRMQGRTGLIEGRRGKACVVKIKDHDKEKTYIIEPTHSLFLLSQYFFSKKTKPFFEQWSQSIDTYMPPFWATFWADQVWRAYIYCDLMQQKKYAEAKKAQYKLPFSLINRDWSSLKLSELQKAHQFLAAMDFRLKNGGSPIALELFYGTFFMNKFR